MNFNEYQIAAHKTAAYSHNFYPFAGLMEEAGEYAKPFIKRDLRGDDKTIEIVDIIAEAGDVLWMLSESLHQQGISLEDVAIYNINKLADRAKRGVIAGDGDHR